MTPQTLVAMGKGQEDLLWEPLSMRRHFYIFLLFKTILFSGLLAACFSLRLFCLMYHNSEVPLLYHCCDGEGKHQYFGSTLGSQTSEKGYKSKYSFVSCLALL